MVSTSTFYGGADYGLSYGNGDFLGMKYKTPFSDISLATNPFTANQIQEVSQKLNTGAKALEVNLAFVDQQGSPAESIPDQHLEELYRLKKLVGVDFTMHGALIEPTGISRQGWDDTQRQQAERQMWISLQKSKKLDPEGNIVVTFHSSNGLPEPETKLIDNNYKENNGERITNIMVVNEKDGQFSNLPLKENELLGTKGGNIKDSLDKLNKESWTQDLSRINHAISSGSNALTGAMRKLKFKDDDVPSDIKDETVLDLYARSKTKEGLEMLNKVLLPETQKSLNEDFLHLNYGEAYIKEAYNSLQNMFNQAYANAKRDDRKEDLAKLDDFKRELRSKASQFEEVKNLPVLADEVTKGVNILTAIETPKIMRPLKEFAIDKASDTFSNLAMKAFNEYGEKAPVISIENPPAGSGLSRAEDLKALIEETRQKFARNLQRKYEDVSEEEAKKQAEKLIGATWDLGHINMLRKFGYDEDTKKPVNLIQQTKEIAPYIKNVHLSDNFGMEHTELPMGMGNVPTKAHMDLINEYQKQVKKVVETGNWYQHFGKDAPIMQTAAALGSGMFQGYGVGPSWNSAYSSATASGASGYFSGYGMNPDIHHTQFGAGFTTLPMELGGSMPGKGSRFSGTAME